MEMNRIPKQGEIYHHFKDKPYQIITVATHTETGEQMVVYQALYGDYKTYVRPLDMFMSEVDKAKYPEVNQKYRFELRRNQSGEVVDETQAMKNTIEKTTEPVSTTSDTEITMKDSISSDKRRDVDSGSDQQAMQNNTEYVVKSVSHELDTDNNEVNKILLRFLDADSYTKKLEVLTSNTKHITDRLINDMAVSLDCTVDEGPLDQRIQGLINCLQAMRRFEDRRMR